jgi:hypothetical protein
LRRWKEQLLGAVDIEAAGGNLLKHFENVLICCIVQISFAISGNGAMFYAVCQSFFCGFTSLCILSAVRRTKIHLRNLRN